MSVTSVKQFTFHDSHGPDSLTVRIPEIVDASYGLYVWPCAPVLAQYIWQNRLKLSGKNVIEIGAGTALPGVVAAKCGANVTLSDCAEFSNCLDLCQQSATLNELPGVAVLGITWGCITPAVLTLPPIDIVLASDCFYDSRDFEDIVTTLSYLLHRNPDAEVWCTYQERSSTRTIEHLLDKWQLYGESVVTPNMETVECHPASHVVHDISLFKLRLRKAG